MKKIRNLLIVFLSIFPILLHARDVYVKGYTKRDGTYVQPHYKTAPNNNAYDNYSTRGNTNPYTGERSYRDPYQDQNIRQNRYDNYDSDDFKE